MKPNPITRLLRKMSISHSSTKNVVQTSSSASTGLVPALFHLPAELLTQILSHLPFPTICTLRLTCHYAAFTLLTSPDILSSWLQRHPPPPLLQSLSPPPTPVTFAYILEQHRRLHIASSLSSVILPGEFRKRCPWPIENNQLQAKLFSALLVLQDYLENLAQLWLTLPTMPIEAPKTFDDVFASREEKSFAKYSVQQVEDADMLWHFLLWMTRHFLNAEQTREERLRKRLLLRRGTSGSLLPLSDEDLGTYILFTNIRGFVSIFESETSQERRRIIRARLASLNPAHNVSGWQDCWRTLSMRLCDPGPSHIQVQGALAMERGRHVVWDDCAWRVISDKYGTEGWQNATPARRAQGATIDFLREVVGYDYVIEGISMEQWMYGYGVIFDDGMGDHGGDPDD